MVQPDLMFTDAKGLGKISLCHSKGGKIQKQ